MPRNISFFLTIDQFKNRSKTVTRRLGWKTVKPGDILMGVEKGQGIPKGGLVRLGLIRVKHVSFEPLNAITIEECEREGFPDMTPAEFVRMFCFANGDCLPEDFVTRIEFEYVD